MKKLIVLIALIFSVGIACGQTVQKGSVIGAYALTIQLDPDVTMNQYLDQYTNYFIPEAEKQFPGVKIFIMKGYTGAHAGGYGLFILCKNVEVYDKYWDKKGLFTEEGSKAWGNLKEANEKMMKMGKMTWDFTDWLLL